MTRFAIALVATILLVTGCDEQEPVGADGIAGPRKRPVENEPPETHLTLAVPPGEMPDTSRSAKTINWWGEDIDGEVVGYQYRWGRIEADSAGAPADTAWYDGDWNLVPDSLQRWVDTTAEQVDFVLPIRSASATFTLLVRAVDDAGAFDPSPASISFPIINSRPSVTFREGSNPRDYELPDEATFTTFPVRTFVWDVSDPDGAETVEKILYALDPEPGDTAWQELAGTESSVTLFDLEAGEHVFWVKAEDVAGFQSPPVHFPDADGEFDPEVWVVKAPAPGGYLIVDDYRLESGPETTSFYREILDDLYNDGEDGLGEVYSVWTLDLLPYSARDVTETLLMFDRVIWYTYRGTPLLTDAFNSMYSFINTPGKRMLLTTVQVDPGTEGVDEGMLLELASDIEQIALRIYGTIEEDPVYMTPPAGVDLPEIRIGEVINNTTFSLVPTDEENVIYRLDPSTIDPPQYEGEPVVGMRRADKSYTLITLPLHLAVDQADVAQFIENTFAE
ncbi:MAG: hypothetical protein MAG453_01967 [Calditrichaeota bacterium]|nr:hypothetical protein [Calditrichota bacterium]